MKKQLLILSLVMFCALSAFAQTPYDRFAPEQSVKSMIELPPMQFKVTNTDPNSEIRSVEFDKNTQSLTLLNNNDSILKTIILNLNDKKFLTMDPLAEKYYSWSPYAYCMNNPIRYVDFRGDSITTIITTTIQNPGGTSSTQYDKYYYGQDESGNYGFIGANGQIYSGDDQFVNCLSASIGILRNGAAGAELVNELMNSTNVVNVAQIYNRGNGADQNGAFIYWNLNSTEGGPDQTGDTTRPIYIGLGHEMAHIQDTWKGTFDASTWTFAGKKAILNADKYATHIENKLRAEHGLPLRTHYTQGVNSTRILHPGTNQSLFYRKIVTLGGVSVPTTPYMY